MDTMVTTFDCSTGEVTTSAPNAEDQAIIDASNAAVAGEASDASARASAAQVVLAKASSDPAFAALATLLGITTS